MEVVRSDLMMADAAEFAPPLNISSMPENSGASQTTIDQEFGQILRNVMEERDGIDDAVIFLRDACRNRAAELRYALPLA